MSVCTRLIKSADVKYYTYNNHDNDNITNNDSTNLQRTYDDVMTLNTFTAR